MQLYTPSLTQVQRLKTREVKIGNLLLGADHPVRIQTMTTTDTLDTEATVAQAIRCIEAGAELVRITAPSRNEAENLAGIREKLRASGYDTPLVADIHFTPSAAETAARIVEKVRINPGNYIDKKKFAFLEYTDQEYREEMERIAERFSPLVNICKQYGTALRIGTNHGSLSDRIMSRYGDTPMGMVESAMEFLRVARDLSFYQIVLSMKASNPLVMVEAYRLLVHHMMDEFGECYPLHLGVTEAGDGEDGRIKSAVGIGTLLEDGIGDTIRVSLTEDPEFEIPVCKDLVARYPWTQGGPVVGSVSGVPEILKIPYDPFQYRRRPTAALANIGGKQVPVVVADFSQKKPLLRSDLADIGYHYFQELDKWEWQDGAADWIYVGNQLPTFPLPGNLRVWCDLSTWEKAPEPGNVHPLATYGQWKDRAIGQEPVFGLRLDCDQGSSYAAIGQIKKWKNGVLVLESGGSQPVKSMRRFIMELMNQQVEMPVLLREQSTQVGIDAQLVDFSAGAGSLLLDGFGDGIWLVHPPDSLLGQKVQGRTYLEAKSQAQFLNNTAFSILQATRTRISKTEYISCPSCGRTLFDLQDTTARIRQVTRQLKGVKIAIMGCIVNGPGEMADADYGYVGSGPGKVTLYKGKEIVRRAIDSEVAVQALVDLIKENDQWVEP